jgi:hypothetical protein
MAKTALPFRIKDLRGIFEHRFELRPGLTLFTGRNGAGKTTSINAAVAAIAGPELARKLPLAIRDGARSGWVQGPGVLLSVGRSVTSEGTPAIELADSGRFADLVRPRFATPIARNKARLEALLSFRPLAVDEPTLLSLCRGDTTVAAAVQGRQPDWERLSLLDLAETVREVANGCGLEREKVATEKDGALSVLRARVESVGDCSGVDIAASSEELTAMIDQAVESLSRMRIEATAREALLSRQCEIRETLGVRPDLDDLDWQLLEAKELVEDLERQLAAARGEAAVRQAKRDAAQRDLEQWNRGQEVLARPVAGPTGEEVQAAEAALAELRVQHEAARSMENAASARMELQAAQRDREAARSTGKDFREIAAGVSTEIARLLSERDLEGITVEDGSLAVILSTGEVRDFEALSFGEQVRTACRIAITAYRDAALPVVAALAPEFWGALDFMHRKELAEVASAEGVYLVAEEPTAGDLEVQHIDAGNAGELLGVTDEAPAAAP